MRTHGTVTQDSRVVQLDGDVHVAGILPGTAETAQIDSQHLTFDTSAQIVSTQDPVTIRMSGRRLDAHGPGRELEGASRAVRIGRAWLLRAVKRGGG